jgi:ubiquinone/menaquinone biosynthesis C-methylase UbiE
MNYDATNIARAYDRGRDHGPEFSEFWMNVVASHVGERQIDTILDLGCGTGRFSQSLADHFDADVIGVDPSVKMLEQARSKQRHDRIRYLSGHGESIPMPDDSADLVFMSMIFHHFDDPPLAAAECRRVLRDGGIVFVRTGIKERIPKYAYADFFPESLPILDKSLPSATLIRDVFETAGFKTIAIDTITQEIAPNYSAYADKLAAGADSILVQLTPHDFDAGMRALRRRADENDSATVVEPIDIFIFQA